MPKFNLVKSIEINAPIETIYQTLNNFNQWTAWSPWLLMEPDAEVKVAGDGKSYHWLGKRVGEGKMQVLSESVNEKIDYSLSFLKPMKSEADVSFLLEQKEGRVKVSWSMHSQLPFFLFWMKKMIIGYVGMDYQRGLTMLKDLLELGSIPSKIEFKGANTFNGNRYIGIKTQSTQANIDQAMERDFTQLQTFSVQHPDLQDGQPFSIYHKWDVVKQIVEYTAAIPVSNVPDTLPAGMVTSELPETKVYTIRHIGSYTHLGNAWSTLYNMQQNKEIKCKKGIHPFEVYINDPAEVDSKDLITDIHFPIK